MSSSLGSGLTSTSFSLSQHQPHLQSTSLGSHINSTGVLGGLSGLTNSGIPSSVGTGVPNSLGLNSIGINSIGTTGISSITAGVSSMNIASMGVTSSASSHALTDGQYSALTSSTGASNPYSAANVSPLPSRANPLSTSTMPPLCQVPIF